MWFVWAGEKAVIALGCAPKADQTSVPKPWRGGLGMHSNEPWNGSFVVRTRSDFKQTQLHKELRIFGLNQHLRFVKSDILPELCISYVLFLFTFDQHMLSFSVVNLTRVFAFNIMNVKAARPVWAPVSPYRTCWLCIDTNILYMSVFAECYSHSLRLYPHCLHLFFSMNTGWWLKLKKWKQQRGRV